MVPPQDIWIEDMAQLVRVRLAPILAQECSPLAPLVEFPMVEENSTTLVQEDGAMVEDDAMAH